MYDELNSNMEEYWIGVTFAIIAGVISNSGIILQKKAVNKLPPKSKEKRFFRSLVRNPVWLSGLILGMFIPAAFVIVAQLYIGPALIPGLESSGLIILAIGSVSINKERLERSDYIGIALVIVGIFFVGMSGLSISIEHFDFNVQWFLVNSILFTTILFVFLIFFEILHRGSKRYRAVLLMFGGSLMFVATNFWIGPLTGTIFKVLQSIATSAEWILFIMACVLLPSVNLVAIAMQQRAYKYGDACVLNTIAQFPQQITPVFIFLFVFEELPPSEFSVPLLLVGAAFIIASSFMLMRRKVEISKIK
jgi:uncharacterized membrane protein YhaH (DUF805 family)